MGKAESTALGIATAGTRRIEPDAEGVFDAIARIGYEFEHAIADLVDNSVDAGATEVVVRFHFDDKSVTGVSVIDNGAGMSDAQLDKAMTFGARTGKGEAHLGKYGMGLKSATFSQCQVLTVISKQRGKVTARRWTAEKAKSDWICEVLETRGARAYLAQHGQRVGIEAHGTIVEWGQLDGMLYAMQSPDVVIRSHFERLRTHLGLVFHRFITTRRLRIRLDAIEVGKRLIGLSEQVTALSPFPAHSGHRDYPKTFTFSLRSGEELSFTAYIWRRDAKEKGFKLGKGARLERQGFYVYRNDRLIQPGGWNGLRNDKEVHTSLARIEFDLPPSLDKIFKPTVQKSAVSMPDELLRAIRAAKCGKTTFADYLAAAESAYREQKPTNLIRHGLIPKSGITKALIKRFEDILGEAEEPAHEVDIVWKDLPPRYFFKVEHAKNAIVLNALYRQTVVYGTTRSAGDAPLVKTLMMLLLKDELGRKKFTRLATDRINAYNALLVAAARAQR